ncbi:MAG TPA: hypothetical protein VGK58_08665, partial [Lacipirellulaceae bacterium]
MGKFIAINFNGRIASTLAVKRPDCRTSPMCQHHSRLFSSLSVHVPSLKKQTGLVRVLSGSLLGPWFDVCA